MKKWIAGAVLATSIISAGGTAFAGEVNGNGDPTPINGFQAGSICAFSGQNDDSTGGGDPFEDGRVQNWGHVLADAKEFIGENQSGKENFTRLREQHANHQIEKVGGELREGMDWINTGFDKG